MNNRNQTRCFIVTREMEKARARLEAIKNKVQPYPELKPEPPIEQPEPNWVASQWDIVNQLRAEVVGWRQKHAEALLEIDRLQRKVDGRSKKYKYTS